MNGEETGQHPDETDGTAGDAGATDETPKRDSRNATIIGLAVLVTILLGAIIGFIASGGLSDDPESEVAPATTSTSLPVVSTTVAPATTVASTMPATTQVPGQLTIPAIEDTFTDAMEPNEVNGLEPILQIENEPPEIKQGLVRFEVTGVPEGATIQEVTLQFLTISAGSQVAVHLVDGDWNEAETNAANAPALGERVGLILPGGDQGTLVELDVTDYVTGPGRIDFYVTTIGDDTTEYAAKEAGVGGPTLIVLYGS